MADNFIHSNSVNLCNLVEHVTFSSVRVCRVNHTVLSFTDHCCQFSLSENLDKKEKPKAKKEGQFFHQPCTNHNHNSVCEMCNLLPKTFRAIQISLDRSKESNRLSEDEYNDMRSVQVYCILCITMHMLVSDPNI